MRIDRDLLEPRFRDLSDAELPQRLGSGELTNLARRSAVA
jgi:hypothetical protein